MIHLFGGDKLCGNAHIELGALGLETTGGDVHVFRRDQCQNLRYHQVVRGQPVGIELEPDFGFQRAEDVDL